MSYGTSDNRQVTPSYVFHNLANALNSTTNAAGQIVCGGTPVNAPTSTVSSTCAPLNIFGQGSPSLAALQYITHLATVDSFNTQRDTNAFIGGDILKVPAGEWKFSAGFENRRESASFTPDDFYTQDLGQTKTTGIAGSYITNEGYFETLLPVFSPAQDIPGLNRLEFEGAARRVDNSIAGDATTYTYAVRWSPIEDVYFAPTRPSRFARRPSRSCSCPRQRSFRSPMILAIRIREPGPGARDTRSQLRRSHCRLQPDDLYFQRRQRHRAGHYFGQHGPTERNRIFQDIWCGAATALRAETQYFGGLHRYLPQGCDRVIDAHE